MDETTIPAPRSSTDTPGIQPERTLRAQILGLVVSLTICAVASGIGGIITAGSVTTWYRTLQKPFFNPPDWVFAPVWTTLFVMMAVAAWRVWRVRHWPSTKTALMLHATQLVLNVMWSALFFGARSPGAALVDVVILLAFVLLTARAFHAIDRVAAWLMVPYAVWVAFATLLNVAIWRLN